MAVIRKDNPVTFDKYAKDHKLSKQRGQKWAKKFVKKEKKLVRLLKLMKALKNYRKKDSWTN